MLRRYFCSGRMHLRLACCAAMNALAYSDIVWDWNGTLLDDAWLCREIMNDQLITRGLPALSLQRYGAIFGFPVKTYYERAGFDFSEEPFEIPAREFIEVYEARRHEASLRPGVHAVLARLRDAGLRQHLLSAYSHASLSTIVAAHGLTDTFTTVAGIPDVFAASKLERGLELATAIAGPARRALLIGDTDHDHEVATEMGADCVLIPAGHQSLARLQQCGVPVLDSLEALF
jgi:phosphoglycolate phosphatase